MSPPPFQNLKLTVYPLIGIRESGTHAGDVPLIIISARREGEGSFTMLIAVVTVLTLSRDLYGYCYVYYTSIAITHDVTCMYSLLYSRIRALVPVKKKLGIKRIGTVFPGDTIQISFLKFFRRKKLEKSINRRRVRKVISRLRFFKS